MAVSRRDFLGLSAATAAGLTLGEWGRRAIRSLEDRPPRLRDGIESWRTAVCGQCPAACGIRVRLVDDWPIKLEGNPLCPLSRGKTCPKGQAGLLAFYDPDRVVGPLRREGERSGGRFKRISWDEALSELASRLQKTRDADGPEAVVFAAPLDLGPRGEILRRFRETYGTPHLFEFGSLRDRAASLSLSMTLGIRTHPVYDVEKARYVLSLATPLLEGWSSPTWLHRAYGHFRRGRGSTRGWLVQAEARLSPTAAKADEWLPLRPGTEADFAFGLAHVLIRENRFDAAFLSSYATGFEEGLRQWILERHDPDSVSARTGVPVVEIIRLAREFSSVRPAMAIAEGYPFSKGLEASWAAFVLNALVGSVDVPGGLLVPEPLPPPWVARPNTKEVKGDPIFAPDRGLAGEGQRPPEVLILMGRLGSPLRLPEGTLEEASFVVSFSSYLDETTDAADLVLPESTTLECWQGAVPEPALASPLVGLARPAVRPLVDTRDSADVLLALARKLGGSLAEAAPWESFSDFLRYQAGGLFSARRGSPFSSSFEADWLRQLEHAGLWTRSYGDFEDFWDRCLGAGGWWDPGVEPGQALRSLPTPSGKIDLFPEPLRRLLERRSGSLAVRQPASEAAPDDPFPLDLFAFEILPLAGLPDRNQASLYEILGQHLQESWEPWVELNPRTASELGLRDRDLVWVESPHARLQARAVLYEGAMPGAAFIPLSVLQKAGGRWVPKGREVALDLLAPSAAPGGGRATGLGTRVRVTRA